MLFMHWDLSNAFCTSHEKLPPGTLPNLWIREHWSAQQTLFWGQHHDHGVGHYSLGAFHLEVCLLWTS